jgi:hypothetical protein
MLAAIVKLKATTLSGLLHRRLHTSGYLYEPLREGDRRAPSLLSGAYLDARRGLTSSTRRVAPGAPVRHRPAGANRAANPRRVHAADVKPRSFAGDVTPCDLFDLDREAVGVRCLLRLGEPVHGKQLRACRLLQHSPEPLHHIDRVRSVELLCISSAQVAKRGPRSTRRVRYDRPWPVVGERVPLHIPAHVRAEQLRIWAARVNVQSCYLIHCFT